MIPVRCLWPALVVTILGATAQPAQACACCTDVGQRTDSVETLDAARLEEIGRMQFSAEAWLFTGEGDADAVAGIASPSERYELRVSRDKERMVFAFRDKQGRAGTLVLAQPKTIAILEADPREAPEGRQGPRLYKEWKLSSPASGAGVFATGMGGGQRLTLVLQGHGNSCTGAGDFTAWTLMMQGPKAAYSLFGSLLPGS